MRTHLGIPRSNPYFPASSVSSRGRVPLPRHAACPRRRAIYAVTRAEHQTQASPISHSRSSRLRPHQERNQHHSHVCRWCALRGTYPTPRVHVYPSPGRAPIRCQQTSSSTAARFCSYKVVSNATGKRCLDSQVAALPSMVTALVEPPAMPPITATVGPKTQNPPTQAIPPPSTASPAAPSR